MTLLPQEYTHFCTKCNQPFTTFEKNIVMFGDILCPKCQGDKLSDWEFELGVNWYPKNPNSRDAISSREEGIKEMLNILYEEYDAIKMDFDEEQDILRIKQAKKELLFNLIKKVQEM